MRAATPLLVLSLILPGCGSQTAPAARNETAAPIANDTAPAAASPSAGHWTLAFAETGPTLDLVSSSGAPEIRLACPTGGKLLVNVPAFHPVGSEERLSFGGGGEVVALVADIAGDKARGGVSGTGDVPTGASRILQGEISASYGAQKTRPHAGPPGDLADRFVYSCERRAAEAPSIGACMTQGGTTLKVPPLRAVGTEPFWGAKVEGRCVTYSDPENQKGTRVWTRYAAGGGGGGTWSGALGGRRFELVLRPKPGCSDGMSEKAYPIAAELRMGADRLSGCAGPD